VIEGLSPQHLGEAGLVYHGTHALQEVAVERLCDSIMLQHIVGREPPLCALLLQVFGEHLPGVLASMIRSEAADGGSVLRPCPCCECLVGHYGLVLGFE
jgi:hypothetical protein